MGWGVGGRWYRLAMEIPPAKRYHMKQRNPRKKPSVLKRKATTARRLHEVIPLADFALIRRFALNCLQFFFPTRGKASFGYIDAFESAFECGIAKEGSAVRPPSSVAGAPPSPSKGKATAVERAFYVLPFILLSNRRYFKILRNATAVERNFLCSTSQSYRKIGAVSNGYEPP